MSLYAIGDLHLSLSSDKPMNVFGEKWNNHTEKISEGFSQITDEDTVVICGDLSWGMSLDECLCDFKFIDSLPGNKIILKGNHDYFWTTAKKINEFFKQNDISSIKILHNNSFEYNDIAICGTRGWIDETAAINGVESHDKKIMDREAIRLETSLKSSENKDKYVFLHYPPIYNGYFGNEILDILKKYEVKLCCYGHIHGLGLKYIFQGPYGYTDFKCVSADFINFKPVKLICD